MDSKKSEDRIPIDSQWKIARYIVFGVSLLIIVAFIATVIEDQKKDVFGLTEKDYEAIRKEFPSTSTSSASSTLFINKEEKYLEAYQAAQEFVKQQLKSPFSAEFPPYDSKFIDYKDGSYTVVAYVDSQNGFGAILREFFICEMEYSVAYEQWNLKDQVYFYSPEEFNSLSR